MSQFKTTTWSVSLVRAAELLEKLGHPKTAEALDGLADWILHHLEELEKIDVPKKQTPPTPPPLPPPAGPRCWKCSAHLKHPTDACPRCHSQVIDYDHQRRRYATDN